MSVIQPSPQSPAPVGRAARAVARCVLVTGWLLLRRRLHLRRQQVGRRLRFADGTEATVYRETVVDHSPVAEPAVLLVTFRLRGVRGRLGHALFRLESLLNTPLFAGFPGLVSKLWLANDRTGAYRGLYLWDGPALAESYARALWRVLALVSAPESIHYQVLAGLTPEQLLSQPGMLDGSELPDWSRVVPAAARTPA